MVSITYVAKQMTPELRSWTGGTTEPNASYPLGMAWAYRGHRSLDETAVLAWHDLQVRPTDDGGYDVTLKITRTKVRRIDAAASDEQTVHVMSTGAMLAAVRLFAAMSDDVVRLNI